MKNINKSKDKVDMIQVKVKDLYTFKERIEIKINDLLNILPEKDWHHFIKKSIKEFTNKYHIAGSTNIRIWNTILRMPVLTGKEKENKKYLMFPTISEDNIQYHIHKMVSVPKKESN